MKNKIFALILSVFALFCPHSINAQSATDVLDKTAQKLKNCGGINASFESTFYKGSSVSGTSSGKISIYGNKFKITSPQMIVWFDGKNQWTMFDGSGEVNLTQPSNEELQSINPYTFVNLYKQGYKNTLSNVTYNGKKCYEVRLKATSKHQSIQEMRVVVDPNTSLPYSIRIKQSGNWMRIRVSQIQTGKIWSDNYFRFNEKEFSNIEVIDLR